MTEVKFASSGHSGDSTGCLAQPKLLLRELGFRGGDSIMRLFRRLLALLGIRRARRIYLGNPGLAWPHQAAQLVYLPNGRGRWRIFCQGSGFAADCNFSVRYNGWTCPCIHLCLPPFAFYQAHKTNRALRSTLASRDHGCSKHSRAIGSHITASDAYFKILENSEWAAEQRRKQTELTNLRRDWLEFGLKKGNS